MVPRPHGAGSRRRGARGLLAAGRGAQARFPTTFVAALPTVAQLASDEQPLRSTARGVRAVRAREAVPPVARPRCGDARRAGTRRRRRCSRRSSSRCTGSPAARSRSRRGPTSATPRTTSTCSKAGAERRTRARARGVPDLDDRPRLQRVDLHRTRRHVDRRRHRVGGDRGDRRALRAAPRRSAVARARHARRDRRARRTPRRGCAPHSSAARS